MIDYRHIYKVMLISRILDEEVRSLYLRRDPALKRPYLYSGKGQEGAASIASLLTENDYLFPHPYRGFTHLIAKGVPLEKIVGEYFCKQTGMLRGFGDVGGFYYYPERGIVGASTILGGNFAIVIGMALAIKKNGGNKIIAIFFGDGEASRSTFGSAINLASLWQLPILFVCENNGLAISVPVEKMSSTHYIAERARGYRIDSVTFDGTEMLPMLKSAEVIVRKVREKKTPHLIEVLTPRFEGHVFAEERLKRDEQIRKTLRDDPLLVIERELVEQNIMKQHTLDEIREEVKREAQRAVTEALAAPQSAIDEFNSFYHE